MTTSPADESSRAEPDDPGVSQPRALLLTSDEELAGEVRRLAAVAECELEQVPDAAAARSSWAEAPWVLLDQLGARDCAQAGLPRRDRVVVISSGEPPRELWRHAVEIHAEQVLVLPNAEQWLVDVLRLDTPHTER